MPIRIPAPAKLNLFLHITGKRADGFHLLESLTFFTEFGDSVEVSEASALSLTITGPFADNIEGDNLVLRAARLLQQQAGIKTGAAITLHKHIPVSAGLGGGSADAAATLIALQRLWKLSPDAATLHSIALQLGSDVPACLLGAPGWMTGTGDHVRALHLPQGAWLVLVNPLQPLLTATVFRNWKGSFTAPVTVPPGWENTASLAIWAAGQSNALEAPARALMPAIDEILASIAATGHCLLARMSGSGATCFGLYDNETSATKAATQLKASHPHWWVTATAMKGTPHGQAQ